MSDKTANRGHVLTHIQASNPCSFRSVTNWARAQGVFAGFAENMAGLVRDGLIRYETNEEGETIIELTNKGCEAQP